MEQGLVGVVRLPVMGDEESNNSEEGRMVASLEDESSDVIPLLDEEKGAPDHHPYVSTNQSSVVTVDKDDGDDGLSRPLLLRRKTMNFTSQIAIIGSNVCPIESLDYE